MFETQSEDIRSLYFDFKSKGEGTFNLEMDWENVWTKDIPSKDTSFNSLKMESYISLKNCDEKNQQKPFNCIQKFLASKRKSCVLPWLKKYVNETECELTDSDEIRNYFDIYFMCLSKYILKM